MKRYYNMPEIKVKAFDAAVHLTNSENVRQQAAAQYTNVKMTQVKINWSEK